jgi:hypothetical protein
MTFYAVVLFVHVTSALVLFATMSFEALSLFHLRGASSLSEVREWLEPVPGLPLAAMGSLLVVLCSGIYLAMRMEAFSLAWPRVAIGAFLLMVPFGAISGKRMRMIRRVGAEAKEMNSGLLARLQDQFLKISVGIRITVFLGILLLMAARPNLWVSLGVVGTSVVLGVLWSLMAWGRSGALSATSADQGIR